MMLSLQWLGFGGIVVGTWFYGTRPFVGAVMTAIGCIPLAVWALLLEPKAYGSFSVQAVVLVLSVRNAARYRSQSNGQA